MKLAALQLATILLVTILKHCISSMNTAYSLAQPRHVVAVSLLPGIVRGQLPHLGSSTGSKRVNKCGGQQQLTGQHHVTSARDGEPRCTGLQTRNRAAELLLTGCFFATGVRPSIPCPSNHRVTVGVLDLAPDLDVLVQRHWAEGRLVKLRPEPARHLHQKEA